ncbi:unnamed protein product [Heterobilharzia americana]|nr:unnamed protein product [Heterobilharzia americana]
MDSLVTNLEIQEQVFNHIFDKLNVSDPFSNPVVVNEALCNPGVCRSQLTELLFETYRIPKLLFYVDCLASYYEFQRSRDLGQTSNCLLISFGYQRTHIVPIIPMHIQGKLSSTFKPLVQSARRLHTGGAHASWMIQRLLQLKYPCHSERITGGLAEKLAHSYCHLASNYRHEMVQWKSDEFRRSHTMKVQLPFNKPSDEDLKALADRKRAQTERLLTVHRKRQQQQLESAQHRFDELSKAEKLMKQGNSPIVKQIISNLGLSNTVDLSQEIHACRRIIDKLQTQLTVNRSGTMSSTIKNETEHIDEEESMDYDIIEGSQHDMKSKYSSYAYLLDMLNTVYTNTFNTVSNELTGRYKRAAEFLISQSLPSAVQSQMTVNTNMNDFKFTEAKLRHRIEMAQDLEFKDGDFVLWLTSLRDRRVYISKKRIQRQSRVDLATQIGLHANDQFDVGLDSSNFSPQLKSSLTTQTSTCSNTVGRNGDSTHSGPGEDEYEDSKKVLTERRRMQLEKIRAMAAELKPSRGRGRGKERRIQPGISRGSLKSRGRGRGSRVESDSRISIPETNPDLEENDPLGDDNSDLFGLDDPIEIEQVTGSVGLNRLWDPDADDNTNEDSNASSSVKKTITTSDYRIDAGDESENERDQLAVMDSLLALYDPETSKDLGITDLKVGLNQFYQIHVDTELMRSHEVLFQPSFMGISEVGLSECLEYVLRDTSRLLDESINTTWPERIFLTGGVAALPGLVERIRCDIRPLLPVGTKWDNIEIVVASDPQLDAWHGARHFTYSPWCEKSYVTVKMYEEYGPYYFKDHPIGNHCWINKS